MGAFDKNLVGQASFSLFGDLLPAGGGCSLDAYGTAVGLMEHLRAPLTVSWDVTMDCHLRCTHCFNMSGSGGLKEELNHEEAMQLCHQLIDLGVLNVCLCGGEPLLRPDLVEIAQTLASAKMVISMVSNGFYLDQRRADELAQAGVRFLQISIDGTNAETHDRLRGVKGSFDRAIAAAHAVARSGMELAVAFCPTRFNIPQFSDYVDMVRSMGAKQIRMMPVLRMGRAEQHRNELIPTPDQMLQLSQAVHQKMLECLDDGITIELGDPLEHMYLFPRNQAKLFILCIRSNGDLTITGYLPVVFGNVRERPIMEYWNAGLADAWRSPLVVDLCNRVQNLEDLRDLDPLPWVEGDLRVDLFEPSKSPSLQFFGSKDMKPVSNEEKFKVRCEHDEVMSLFPLENDEGRQVHFLNPNATFLYRQCNGKRSFEELVHSFQEAYPHLDANQSERDVEDCLHSLAELGVIKWKANGKKTKPRAGLVVRFADERDFRRISYFVAGCIGLRKQGKARDHWYLPVDVQGYYHPVAVRTRQFHSREIHYLLERAGKILGVGSLTFVAPPLSSAQIGCLVVKGKNKEEDKDLAAILLDGLSHAGQHLCLTKIKCGVFESELHTPFVQLLQNNGYIQEAILKDEMGVGGHINIFSRMLPVSEVKS